MEITKLSLPLRPSFGVPRTILLFLKALCWSHSFNHTLFVARDFWVALWSRLSHSGSPMAALLLQPNVLFLFLRLWDIRERNVLASKFRAIHKCLDSPPKPQ